MADTVVVVIKPSSVVDPWLVMLAGAEVLDSGNVVIKPLSVVDPWSMMLAGTEVLDSGAVVSNVCIGLLVMSFLVADTVVVSLVVIKPLSVVVWMLAVAEVVDSTSAVEAVVSELPSSQVVGALGVVLS